MSNYPDLVSKQATDFCSDLLSVLSTLWGEHKVKTPKQQFLGTILCFFYAFEIAVAIAFLWENAVEAI